MSHNSYELFYHNLKINNWNPNVKKVHRYQKLSVKYIKNIVETIFQKNVKTQTHEKAIRLLFGFDTNLISYEQTISEYNLEESEFNTIIEIFLKSFFIKLYFEKKIFKVFLYFSFYYIFISLISSLNRQIDFLSIIRGSVIQVLLVNLVFVLTIPFITFTRRYLSSARKNILRNYELSNSNIQNREGE